MSSSNNNKIEKILQSLDEVAKARVPDFFYTRLKSRMEKELLLQPVPFFILRPAFLTACLAVLLAFNIITIRHNRIQSPTPVSTGSGTIESFAKEYNLVTNDLYQ